MGDDPVPLEILPITKQYGGASTTVDRLDAYGRGYPVWMLLNNSKEKGLAVVYADPRRQSPAGEPLASARFHTFSSKIDVWFRGAEFKMRNDNPMRIADKHTFSFLGASPMAWRQSAVSSSIYYEDAYGRVLAAFKKRRNGLLGQSSPCFELYVPAASLDMDLLVVTGLVVVAHAKKTDKEAETAGEVIGGVMGV